MRGRMIGSFHGPYDLLAGCASCVANDASEALPFTAMAKRRAAHYGSGYAAEPEAGRVEFCSVRCGKARLGARAVDGRFGPRTEAAVLLLPGGTGLAAAGSSGPPRGGPLRRPQRWAAPRGRRLRNAAGSGRVRALQSRCRIAVWSQDQSTGATVPGPRPRWPGSSTLRTSRPAVRWTAGRGGSWLAVRDGETTTRPVRAKLEAFHWLPPEQLAVSPLAAPASRRSECRPAWVILIGVALCWWERCAVADGAQACTGFGSPARTSESTKVSSC